MEAVHRKARRTASYGGGEWNGAVHPPLRQCFGHASALSGQGHASALSGQGHASALSGQGHASALSGQGHASALSGKGHVALGRPCISHAYLQKKKTMPAKKSVHTGKEPWLAD
eukprot:1157545-Pelagomonas_calceolata.AAC.3